MGLWFSSCGLAWAIRASVLSTSTWPLQCTAFSVYYWCCCMSHLCLRFTSSILILSNAFCNKVVHLLPPFRVQWCPWCPLWGNQINQQSAPCCLAYASPGVEVSATQLSKVSGTDLNISAGCRVLGTEFWVSTLDTRHLVLTLGTEVLVQLLCIYCEVSMSLFTKIQPRWYNSTPTALG